MLISFTLSNFRSFAKEQTLSLVASRRLTASHSEHTLPIPGSEERLLPVAVIYGANGAGKSNLFAGLRYFKRLALRTRSKSAGTGRVPFHFGEAIQESTFDVQFIHSGHVYRFGINLDDHKITEEWLVRVEGSREKVVYERSTSKDGEVKISQGPLLNPSERLKALCIVGAPQNQTFLATAKAILSEDDLSPEINQALEWFDDLVTIGPDQKPMGLLHMLDQSPALRTFSGEFLRNASTGIQALEVVKEEIKEEDFRQQIPEQAKDKLLNSGEGETSDELVLVGDGEGHEFLFDPDDGKHFYRLGVSAKHDVQGKQFSLPLTEQSDGTRRLLDLVPTLHSADKNVTLFFIDEVDRSLHPILVRKYIEYFLKSCAHEGRQIILTTHDATLLDLELLRRDEIWFAEKGNNLETAIYPLSDFRVRNDLEVGKHYLQGRFGAIPFLGNFDALSSCKDEVGRNEKS